MNNRDIDKFFDDCGLTNSIEKHVRPPNEMWTFAAGQFPMLIQTQESANRMRIVAFIADAASTDAALLRQMLEANYHSALDARYALTDGKVVSVFLHPFAELTKSQFVLGLYQTVSCAATFGSSYSGGTMFFGAAHGGNGNGADAGQAEAETAAYLDELVRLIR